MKKTPYFSWDAEEGIATCIIQNHNDVFYGTAKCHPNDIDMQSEKTGYEIAYRRALLKAIQKEKEKLGYELKGLEKYYYTMNKSKYFDEDSYPIRRLVSQIENIKTDIFNLDSEQDIIKKSLKEYINLKDDFYKKIRKNRQKG